MDLSVTKLAALISLLITLSATYNAYILRGGKLVWSEVLIALAMVLLALSLALRIYIPYFVFVTPWSLADTLFILGFIVLLGASFKLRSALRSK